MNIYEKSVIIVGAGIAGLSAEKRELK